MILSDTNIIARINAGDLLVQVLVPDADGSITNEDSWELPDLRDIQPASVDLHLGKELIIGSRTMTMDDGEVKDNFIGTSWDLIPGDLVLGDTRELITLPDDLAAQCVGLSSHARQGLAVDLCGGWIDPGFRGTVTVELVNHGHRSVRLTPGMRICQVVFHQLLTPASIPYGDPRRQSKYQGSMHPVAMIPDGGC